MGQQRVTESELLELLERAVTAAGGSVQRTSARLADQPDLTIEIDGRTFVVELKTAPDNRAAVLQGLMAAAWLQARRFAANGGEPLPIVGVPRLTDRTLTEVARFMIREVPEAAWGMIDGHGRRVFHGLKGVDLDSTGALQPRRKRPESSHDPYTDLGQWMAKVLVAKHLPATLLAARRSQLSRARHLARAARVSEPTAAGWVKSLRAKGFIEASPAPLRLVRAREFFENWQRAVSAKPRHEIAVRFSLPTGPPDVQLHQALARYPFQRAWEPPEAEASAAAISVDWGGVPRACLGLFEASAALGGGFVLGAPMHVYLESVTDQTLQTLGLEPASEVRAQLRVIEPHWPESVFRGAVIANTRNNQLVPTCDIVQAWLDVADHPARGRAQADEIERHVLADAIFGEMADGSRP